MGLEDLEISYVSNYSKIGTFFDMKRVPFPNFLRKGVSYVEKGYEFEGSLPGDDRIILYCHGWRCTDERFKDQLTYIKKSMESQGVKTGFLGWRWRSDLSWATANKAAEITGKEMADFIEQVRKDNPEVKLIIIGYSLGAKVVLESLSSLERPQEILSQVFLLVGAVGRNSLTKGEQYRELIKESDVEFFSYRNPNDKVLKFLFPLQGAIGREEIPSPKPDNFHEFETEYDSSLLAGKKVHKSYMNEESVLKQLASEID